MDDAEVVGMMLQVAKRAAFPARPRNIRGAPVDRRPFLKRAFILPKEMGI
jgi:hypothetical protein